MDELSAAALTAAWLGILTSISPCPLATNIAAISFVGRRIGSMRAVLLAGGLYALGRTAVYVALGALLSASLLAIPPVSTFLQRSMDKILGPVLVLVGVVLTGLLPLPLIGSGAGGRAQKLAGKGGVWAALPLGALFALAFCPVSAALFFGSLIPLSVKLRSTILLPCIYGAGTALPVIVFAGAIAAGARALGALFNRLTAVEKWVRLATGWVFIATGVYFSLKYIFGVI